MQTKIKPNVKVFDFNKDLADGLKDQARFWAKTKRELDLVPVTHTQAYDFTNSAKDIAVELKTDSYDSSNFFFERYSSIQAQTPGGPWQSHGKNVDVLFYWFKNKQLEPYYGFALSELIEFLDCYVKKNKPRLIEVKNKGYTTGGYLIPIQDVIHLAHIQQGAA